MWIFPDADGTGNEKGDMIPMEEKMDSSNMQRITPEMAKTLPGINILKTDASHFSLVFQNNPTPQDVVRMASSILIAASRNQAWRDAACTEFAKSLPGLLKNLGIQSNADSEIAKLRKSVDALTASVRSYGGNPEKILRNAGV